METTKLIALLMLFVYFLYKLIMSTYVYFKTDLKEIQKAIPSIKNKIPYLLGIIEHFILLLAVYFATK